MATATIKRLYGPAQPGASNGTLYTATGVTTIVKEIIVTNTDSASQTVSIAINGTSATAANCILSAYSVTGNTTLVFALSTVLGLNDTIQGLQGVASKITVTISGVEFA